METHTHKHTRLYFHTTILDLGMGLRKQKNDAECYAGDHELVKQGPEILR